MKSTNWGMFFAYGLCATWSLASLGAAQDRVAILSSGEQPGHYWIWKGKPILPIGDSVTQGWMESGANFDQTGYIDALSQRGVHLAMIWSYIGTDAGGQTDDVRIGYNAPEIWPWQGGTDGNTINLNEFNQDYFDRLKSFVSYAETKDVLFLITVHDGGPKWRWENHPFNAIRGNGPLSSGSQYVELADYDNEMPETFDPSWNRLQKNQYFQERFADKLITELAPYTNVVFEMFNNLDDGSGQSLGVEWYDPRTGVTASDGVVAAVGAKAFAAPDRNDWILRIGKSEFPATAQVTGWEFNSVGDHEGWLANATAGDQDVSNGMWNLTPSGSDPVLIGPMIDVDADVATIIEIGMLSTEPNTDGKLFWTVASDGTFSETRSQVFTVLGDGEMHIYRFDLAVDPDWAERITQIRLDPAAEGNGGDVSIDFIRILTFAMRADFDRDGDVDGDDFLIWQASFGVDAGGDGDNDGDTDGDDFLIWQSQFGSGSPAASAAVPEPASILLLIAALVGAGLSGRGP